MEDGGLLMIREQVKAEVADGELAPGLSTSIPYSFFLFPLAFLLSSFG